MSMSEEMIRLVAVDELPPSGVVTVSSPHGKLAVGLAAGRAFAVSDRCRHLFASLGGGRVTEEGCLECPWHKARYDVSTGKMVRGPQGAAFVAMRGVVKGAASRLAPLKSYPVTVSDGVIYLALAERSTTHG